MTAILSLLCSEPLVPCGAHRKSTSELDYLLESCSWDHLCGPADDHKSVVGGAEETAQNVQPAARAQFARSPTMLSDGSSNKSETNRKQRLRRFMTKVSSALNPRNWSRDGSCESVEHFHQRPGPSRAVSFAERPSTSYRILPDEGSFDYDDSEQHQHFAIVDIVPGQQPRWIGDASRCDRSTWLSAEPQQTRSFDASLQRRRSVEAARNVRLQRRAYSLNRVLEWDAINRRHELAKRMAKRPESSFISQNVESFDDPPTFYTNEESDLYDSADMDDFGYEQPISRYEQFRQDVPPRPPKPYRHNELHPFRRHPFNNNSNSHNSLSIDAPPRPPKPRRTGLRPSASSGQVHRLVQQQEQQQLNRYHPRQPDHQNAPHQRLLRRQKCALEEETGPTIRIHPICR